MYLCTYVLGNIVSDLLLYQNIVVSCIAKNIFISIGLGCRNLTRIILFRNLTYKCQDSRPMRPRNESGVKHEQRSLVFIDLYCGSKEYSPHFLLDTFSFQLTH